MSLVQWVSQKFIYIKKYLQQAGINESLDSYIKKVLIFSFLSSCVFGLFVFLLFLKSLSLLLLLVVIASFVTFFYFGINYPYIVAKNRSRDIDAELMFGGRHLLISLKSGVPLFNALGGLTRGYGELSVEIRKIIDLVSVGVPLHDAMKQVAEQTPSRNLRRLLMQLVNSLLFGTEVHIACESIVYEIAKETEIEVREYGQKLNPIVIGFLILGIVFPSIFVAFSIIVSTLFSTVVRLEDISLFIFFLIILIIQIAFVLMVKSNRLKVL